MAVAIEIRPNFGHEDLHLAEVVAESAETSDPVADRIAEVERGRHARLLARARELRLTVDPDYARADACVVWSPLVRGRCEIVMEGRCSCREFRLFESCPHHALVTETMGGAK